MSDSLMKRAALGAAGGLAGSFAIQGAIFLAEKFLPQAHPPMRDEPGGFMVKQAKKRLRAPLRKRIPSPVDKAAGMALGIGYGMMFGAAYGAIRRDGGSRAVDAAAVGVATWAAGYAGWLPLLGLTPPLTKQKPTQIAGPLMEHLLFGAVTVATVELIDRAW
jgi:hypothetical protein